MSIFPRTFIDLALISLLICFTNQVTEYNSKSEITKDNINPNVSTFQALPYP